ncbi:hypothetical protein E2C01_092675 [Portunus trituberculatus]|uniref:Uncharacterized protein n=1 Tax=Portunus trituberculatus TaxID=210409 RepID=A0A5B7JSD4_PORTR|nr:hypothetical protein [Portunus trituberculatus]
MTRSIFLTTPLFTMQALCRSGRRAGRQVGVQVAQAVQCLTILLPSTAGLTRDLTSCVCH